MLRVIGSVIRNHDLGLVVLACLVCVASAATATAMLDRGQNGTPGQSRLRLGAAILAFASGAWTTHFIGMLAMHSSLGVSFAAPSVMLFLVLSLIGIGVGFALNARSQGQIRAMVVSGLILAGGIVAMQFVGTSVLLSAMPVQSGYGLLTVSLGLGGLVSIAAAWLMTINRPRWASACLALSVVLIHFIAPGSAILDTGGVAAAASADTGIAVAAAGSCLVILALAAAVCVIDARMTTRLLAEASHFRCLTDATFDGLVFERFGRIVAVNRAMCALAGSNAATLVGLRLADLIADISLTAPASEKPAEHLVLLPDGQTCPVEVHWRVDAVRDGHILAIRDLSRQKAAESKIQQLSSFDQLTGLANRDRFEQQVRQAIAFSDRGTGGVALLHIDIDRFDSVNEAMGPWAGEQILIETARRLTGTVRETDTVARLGRDEFAVIQSLTDQPEDAAVLAGRIVAAMALPFSVDDQTVPLSASIGIALYPADSTNVADLAKKAALALRQAKLHGRGRWRYFEPGMDLLLRSKRSLELDMRIALSNGQFSVNYQPFVAIESQQTAGYEALLRWDHPERGRIAPVDFIPLAEECGLIVPIGIWVLATACAEAVAWDHPLIISVNLSPAQFVQPGLVATVADVLQRTGLPAGRLELEITEGILMDDTQNALRILTELKTLGVKIAMDDFGTGYSSLSYLRKFPFDKIKIDRSFISDVEEDAEAETIVQAIIAMSRSLRLAVTAEGVETQRQLNMLQAHGCTYAQGYLLGKPCSADQLTQQAARQRSDHSMVWLVAPAA